MSLNDLRRNDYSLDEDMTAVHDLFLDFFTSEVPTTRVRAAEPFGFDDALWRSLKTVGAVSMGLPESVGGDDVSLVTLTLVTEPLGARLAPVPLISQIVATRLLARALDGPGAEAARSAITAVVGGNEFVGVAAEPLVAGRPQLIPDGALTRTVLAFDGDDLVLVGPVEPGPQAGNQASLPLAWWTPDPAADRVVLLSGGRARDAIAAARDDSAVLTAAALVGMTQTALEIACEFTRTRFTMGVPVGSLQGVSFPLTDVAINVDGTRNLLRRAAWFLDHERDEGRRLARAALVAATRTATHGTTTSAHMQGGLGFTVEADASLYFLRSKGWAAVAGNPDRELAELGRLRLTSVT